MTDNILDHDTQKIIYRSAVGPKKSSTPNHRLASHGGEVSTSSDSSEDKKFLWITTWIPRRFLTETEGPYSLHQVQR